MVLLNLLLEEILVEEWNVTVLINDTPALEALGVTVNLAHLETTKHAHDVNVVEGVVILSGGAQVKLRH